MGGTKVLDFYLSLFHGSFEGGFLHQVAPYKTLNRLAGSRFCGSPEMRLELKAVENRRVMTSCDHDPTDGVLLLHRKRNRRSRRRIRHQHYIEPVADEHFGGNGFDVVL